MPTWKKSEKDYNNNKYIKNTHNCYSYFLNKIDPKLGKECKDIVKKNKSKNKN